jgi:hypothetical protein
MKENERRKKKERKNESLGIYRDSIFDTIGIIRKINETILTIH